MEDILIELLTAYTNEGDIAHMERIFSKAAFPLHKCTFKIPLVHISVANGDDHVLDYLFEKGFDLNIADPAIHGGTVMHRCAINNDLRMLKHLLKRKAYLDLDMIDEHGRTPLHIACIKGYSDIACALIESGANLTILDIDGKPPRYYADINRLNSVSARLPPFQYDWEHIAKQKKEEMKKSLLYTETTLGTIKPASAVRKNKPKCNQPKRN